MILSLFFTRKMSLEIWLNNGLLKREKLIYEKHINDGTFSKVNWFTYGINDSAIARELVDSNQLNDLITVYEMPRIFNSNLGVYIYMFLMPIIYFRVLKNSHILKTNQMDGGFAAIFSSLITRVPVIVRTGFTLSLVAKKMDKPIIIRCLVWLLEYVTFRFANAIIVSSMFDRDYITDRYNISYNKVNVLYNYIDTHRFFNKHSKRVNERLITVGRLEQQKNLFSLIEAVAKTKYSLDIYGEGSLKDELVSFAREKGADISFKGVVSNDMLVDILNSYNYFILASYYEGMPKVLLEAMSCGCLCIGTNVMGIKEVLVDGVNGYLADSTDVIDIFLTIKRVKYSDDIAARAVDTIQTTFSLESFSEKEKNIMRKVVNASK